MDHQHGRGAGLPGILAGAARALAEAPAGADDAALLSVVARAIVPSLGDVVALYAADPSGALPLIVATSGDAPPVRHVGESTDRREITAPIGDEAAGDDLLVIRSLDPERVYDEVDRSAAEVLAALLTARRAASRQAVRESTLRQQLETLALAGRELAHALNNDLTMPVGVIELLMDRTGFSPDLQEMLQAASKDLGALEQHVKDFHDLMRRQTDAGSTLPPR